MGTISEKLTYLNETKSKLKDNINLTGAGLTNQTPFRQYATDLKTALLNILNNGIDTLYNNFPKTTGTGTNITLNNTLQAPIRSVINGDTQQDGEPTPDNPKEIKSVTGLQKVKVEGKNLFDKDNANILNALITNTGAINSNASTRTLYIPCNPNTTYTISKISSPRFVVGTTENIPSVGSSTLAFSDFSTGTSGTITTGNNAHYLLVYYYNSSGTATEQEILDSTQIEIGEATEYEPYQSQEYEINLGKNLFDINNVTTTNTTNWTINANNNILSITHNNSYSTGSPKIDFGILPSGTYILSGIFGSSLNLNINGSYSKSLNNGDTFTCNGEETITLAFPVASFPSGTTLTYQNVMLEKGTQSTSYSSYFTPIHLYEGDQIIGTLYNWSIKHVMGEVVLDGSETYTNAGLITNVRRYSTLLTNAKLNVASNTDKYSNYFTYNYDYNLDEQHFYISNNGQLILFSTITDMTQFKTWLSTHNTKVVYKLAEPTTTPITNTELIEDLNNFYNAKSYNGQTNISVEGDLQMILDVSAIKGE